MLRHLRPPSRAVKLGGRRIWNVRWVPQDVSLFSSCTGSLRHGQWKTVSFETIALYLDHDDDTECQEVRVQRVSNDFEL